MTVTVSLAEVIETFEMAGDELSSYVNQKTGKVVTVQHEELRLAEAGGRDGLPEWQRAAVEQARRILVSDDWLQLPDKLEIDEWELMDRFGRSREDAAQREAIGDAIHGTGAFRMFKSTIQRLGIEQAWYTYKQSTFEGMARDWLEANGLAVG